jgi:DNA-binding NtrC family response regulator
VKKGFPAKIFITGFWVLRSNSSFGASGFWINHPGKAFLDNFCNENKYPKRLSANAQKKLLAYSFPGNVRELKSLVELAVTLSGQEEITADDFNIDSGESITTITGLDLTLREYEMKILKATLHKCNNDISLAARKLDIGVSTIYRMLKQEKESGI